MQNVVIDNGTSSFKSGIAGDEFPKSCFPSVVGFMKNKDMKNMKDSYVGDEAISKRGILDLKTPIEKGEIKDWNGIEKVWHHIYHQHLKINLKRMAQ